MSTITLEEAEGRLAELVNNLQPGEEVVITRDKKVVAKLVGQKESARPPRRPGTLRGTVTYMAPDFSAPLGDLQR